LQFYLVFKIYLKKMSQICVHLSNPNYLDKRGAKELKANVNYYQSKVIEFKNYIYFINEVK